LRRDDDCRSFQIRYSSVHSNLKTSGKQFAIFTEVVRWNAHAPRKNRN